MKAAKCPRHGRDYLVRDGSAIYCGYPTPDERFSRCFYHVYATERKASNDKCLICSMQSITQKFCKRHQDLSNHLITAFSRRKRSVSFNQRIEIIKIIDKKGLTIRQYFKKNLDI